MFGSAGTIPGLSSTISAPKNGKAPALPAKPGAATPAASTLAMMARDDGPNAKSSAHRSRTGRQRSVEGRLRRCDRQEARGRQVRRTAIVSALASLPTKSAREKLKEVLHKDRNKGPQDFGKVETADTAAAASERRPRRWLNETSPGRQTSRRGERRCRRTRPRQIKLAGTQTVRFNLQLPGKAADQRARSSNSERIGTTPARWSSSNRSSPTRSVRRETAHHPMYQQQADADDARRWKSV